MKKSKITLDQAKDTGLAIILILLLATSFTDNDIYLIPAIVVLVMTMTWPGFFKVPARLWFGFSHLLGTIVSKILLTVVYAVVATPIGLLRRWGGIDAMRRGIWKKEDSSAFVERNHTYTAEDIEKPY